MVVQQRCECGSTIYEGNVAIHEVGNIHQEWLASQKLDKPRREPLAPDLQSILDCNDSPILKAKMTRAAYAARNWPNQEHPGTVKDFLDEHSIPYYDWEKGDNMAERRIRVGAWEKEQLYG